MIKKNGRSILINNKELLDIIMENFEVITKEENKDGSITFTFTRLGRFLKITLTEEELKRIIG